MTTRVTLTRPDWYHLAACRDEDPEHWFAEGRGATQDRAYAVSVCNTCPVRKDCRDWALAGDIRTGVWGGLTEAEREAIRKGAR